ncbi:hypothetical protein [Ruminococcus albus]|uniref:Uncharacterized protein n=1 Tax=Ruminococcus albus (strain ATCC 27210 / DSM 20455 / JCM 14654 / NCDO 2250 / 7) TaxID=697329 RepID=E6UAT7_RUMA7|nr:hypothetical protein [Ruminococcus albus]ADU21416.1 hypothetical protein Rumal_0889 [Ruminococcus albus 7 = DSM 20455]
MKDKLNALTESVSLSDAEKLADELASFDDDKLTDEEQQRILSSVMRKAGFEMNNTNSVITAKRNITSRTNSTNEEQSTGKIQLRRGGAIAACIAIIAAGGVIFSLNRNMHNTVPNNDRDSSIYNEAVTTDPEDDNENSTNESETDTEDIINDSTDDNNDSKTDNKKDAKTDNRNDNESVIVVDANKENNKDNNINENKTDDTNSLKDRIREDIDAKLDNAYPNHGIYRINDNRYLVYDWSENATGDYMIYDVPSDSIIATVPMDKNFSGTLDDKFATLYNPDDAPVEYSIYDTNGNLVYDYNIDIKKAGIFDNEKQYSGVNATPNGKKLIFDIWNKDATKTAYYCFDYENQKKAFKIAEFYSKDYLYFQQTAISNDLLVISCGYKDGSNGIDLYTLDTNSSNKNAAHNVMKGTNDHPNPIPHVVKDNDVIYLAFENDNRVSTIRPDANGNVKVGDKNYTVTEYDLNTNGNNGHVCLSQSGKYALSVNTNNGKMKFTLYETADGNLNELKTIEKSISDIGSDKISNEKFNENTGDFEFLSMEDDKDHIINFFK